MYVCNCIQIFTLLEILNCFFINNGTYCLMEKNVVLESTVVSRYLSLVTNEAISNIYGTGIF